MNMQTRLSLTAQGQERDKKTFKLEHESTISSGKYDFAAVLDLQQTSQRSACEFEESDYTKWLTMAKHYFQIKNQITLVC
jgi:hypothetical protein